MIIKGKRALAYVERVHDIKPIENADNIELAHILGWTLIVKKGEFKDGDKAVYIEIDSQVPEIEQFEFLRQKHFKVGTYKLNKFKVVSQGLALPLTSFPELGDINIGTDVTEKLGITYSNIEDNTRKGNNNDLTIQSLKSRKQKLFNNSIIKWLMKKYWGKKLVILLFSKKKDKPLPFPTHLTSKTDEERIENLPFLLGTGPYVVTEKIDGSSATYAIEKKHFNKFEFYVCSRNIRQKPESQPCFYDKNIYWEMAIKYDIKNKMIKMFKKLNCKKSLVIQGEIVGKGVQQKTYGFVGREFFVFNLKVDGERKPSLEAKEIVNLYDFKHVPIINTISKLPETMDEIKLCANGYSLIGNGISIREGLVYRSLDGKQSFKNVSIDYLLEKHN